MRDIISYYTRGHLVHATAATHRGKPMLIGEDSASAETSKYDKERLERLKKFRAAQEKDKEAEAEVERAERAAAATATPVPAPAPVPEGSGAAVHKQRRSAGKSTKAPAVATADTQAWTYLLTY